MPRHFLLIVLAGYELFILLRFFGVHYLSGEVKRLAERLWGRLCYVSRS